MKKDGEGVVLFYEEMDGKMEYLKAAGGLVAIFVGYAFASSLMSGNWSVWSLYWLPVCINLWVALCMFWAEKSGYSGRWSEKLGQGMDDLVMHGLAVSAISLFLSVLVVEAYLLLSHAESTYSHQNQLLMWCLVAAFVPVVVRYVVFVKRVVR